MSLPTDYQQFIFKSRYARFLESERRREEWHEAVNRYMTFMLERVPDRSGVQAEFVSACMDIMDLQVMPSMRALWTAGKALERENLCAYNCAYLEIKSPKKFAEMLYALMCGCGVGQSVERQYVTQLPEVPANLERCDDVVVVFQDSKEDWAGGYLTVMNHLYQGRIPAWDLRWIRPKGSRLKTFGGRASGPEPLDDLLRFTVSVFEGAKGRKLNSLECYDICCYIAKCVVAGGVRRSATICLTNFSDNRMAHAKDGQFWLTNPQRTLSNNSVAYTEKPDCKAFMAEWLDLARSGSGERGIFNREGAKHLLAAGGRRDPNYEFGCNPCSEIILRSEQLCNLTEVIVRPGDSLNDLADKVKSATILGAVQATLTNFGFVDSIWRHNCEEERLLGVSLTGLRDHEVLQSVKDPKAPSWLNYLKGVAVTTAQRWSEILGINMPAAITCVKPSGTVSKLVNCSAGLHARHAPYFISRVRNAMTDPMTKFLIDAGVPWNPEVGEERERCTTAVFEFPMKSPIKAIFRDQVSAIEQLEYWKMLQAHWCEHKPSCTVTVMDHEWLEAGHWIYKNWDLVSGISFMPYDISHRPLMPLEAVSVAQYEKLKAQFPELNFSRLSEYENDDFTTGAQEYACAAGGCEI